MDNSYNDSSLDLGSRTWRGFPYLRSYRLVSWSLWPDS
jgi:hypothetical protein